MALNRATVAFAAFNWTHRCCFTCARTSFCANHVGAAGGVWRRRPAALRLVDGQSSAAHRMHAEQCQQGQCPLPHSDGHERRKEKVEGLIQVGGEGRAADTKQAVSQILACKCPKPQRADQLFECLTCSTSS